MTIEPEDIGSTSSELAVEDGCRLDAESRLAAMAPAEIERQVDLHFPYRSEADQPQYRPHQRDTILKAINAIRAGKRFVLIDGPVGCGKSAINYTIGEICGSSLYLTSQKQLQDQVARECWKNVKMVKGKGAYSCNFVSSTEDMARCNYKGDKYRMCNNATMTPANFSLAVFADNVKATIKRFSHDERMMRMKTAFEKDDDVDRVIRKIMDFVESSLPVMTQNRLALSHKTFASRMCCKCNPNLECPARSSRFIAKLFGTKVLNPDVLYALQFNGLNRFFANSELMVIDECHSIESFISRIFGIEIPVDIIHQIFGAPCKSLACATNSEFILEYAKFGKGVIAPTVAISKLLTDMRDLMNATCFMDVLKSKFKDSWAYQSLVSDMKNYDRGNFEMLKLIANILRQKGKEYDDTVANLPAFSNAVYGKYIEYTGGLGFPFDMMEWMIPGCARYFKQAKVSYSEDAKTDDVFYSRHIVMFAEMLLEIDRGINTLLSVKNKDHPAFVISCDNDKHFKPSYESVDGLERPTLKYFGPACKDKFMHVTLTPVVTSAFLHAFFYSCAEHVVLSTGTWIHPESMMATYGVDASSSEYIRIPTTFPKSNRPVFVISDRGKTNFSEKTEEGVYVYKTPEGTQKFCNELSDILESARERIRAKSGINANAIVHCHTFDIARRIAEHMVGVDDTFLIHIGPHDRDIVNEHTKFTTCPMHKDDLVQQFMGNPDTGLTLVSASVSEGVDFKDGIARLQVLLKKPIPYLGDPYVRARFKGDPTVGLERDPVYMDRVVFNETIQQYGRIMRTQDDWGVTIVFDQAMAKSLWYALRPGAKSELNLDYFLQGIRGGIRNGKVYFDQF